MIVIIIIIIIIIIILIEIIIIENLRTVESTYWYAIAMLCDWFINLGPVFQSIRSKIETNLNAPCTHGLSDLKVITRNFDWFVRLFAPVVNG